MVTEIKVPNIGNYSNVDVIEILVKIGDTIDIEDNLITLETDKAALEIPSPIKGVVKEILVKVGDKVSIDSPILKVEELEASSNNKTSEQKDDDNAKAEQESVEFKIVKAKKEKEDKEENESKKSFVKKVGEKAIRFQEKLKEQVKAGQIQKIFSQESISLENIHASPSVRRFARELGVNILEVNGTGPKNRITKEDIQTYVKSTVKDATSHKIGAGLNVAPMPKVEYEKYGEIELKPLSRIRKLSGSFLHRNWVTVPHVTQFDEADITELEDFRTAQKDLAEKQGVKLTPLVFLMKAVVAGLKAFPTFNSSLDESGENLILKKYFHIAVAVDTKDGLVVPVVRDVDKKGLFQLAKELGEISVKARDGKLKASDMIGSCFTISSLGGIGGTAFTPIVNVPDVAILGVSRSQMKPTYINGEFQPRLILPLSLSYDHRVIDGADAVRFTTFLTQQLSDIRRLLL